MLFTTDELLVLVLSASGSPSVASSISWLSSSSFSITIDPYLFFLVFSSSGISYSIGSAEFSLESFKTSTSSSITLEFLICELRRKQKRYWLAFITCCSGSVITNKNTNRLRPATPRWLPFFNALPIQTRWRWYFRQSDWFACLANQQLFTEVEVNRPEYTGLFTNTEVNNCISMY